MLHHFQRKYISINLVIGLKTAKKGASKFFLVAKHFPLYTLQNGYSSFSFNGNTDFYLMNFAFIIKDTVALRDTCSV